MLWSLPQELSSGPQIWKKVAYPTHPWLELLTG